MITGSIKFFGAGEGQFGMPDPYHSYFVVATLWETEGSGIASAMALSPSSPLPDSPHTIVREGGEEFAYSQLLSKLRELVQNRELKELEHRD